MLTNFKPIRRGGIFRYYNTDGDGTHRVSYILFHPGNEVNIAHDCELSRWYKPFMILNEQFSLTTTTRIMIRYCFTVLARRFLIYTKYKYAYTSTRTCIHFCLLKWIHETREKCNERLKFLINYYVTHSCIWKHFSPHYLMRHSVCYLFSLSI